MQTLNRNQKLKEIFHCSATQIVKKYTLWWLVLWIENTSYWWENYELYSTSVAKLCPPILSLSKQPAADQGMQGVINSLWIQCRANHTQTQNFFPGLIFRVWQHCFLNLLLWPLQKKNSSMPDSIPAPVFEEINIQPGQKYWKFET